jgi:hypothetical protein
MGLPPPPQFISRISEEKPIMSPFDTFAASHKISKLQGKYEK